VANLVLKYCHETPPRANYAIELFHETRLPAFEIVIEIDENHVR